MKYSWQRSVTSALGVMLLMCLLATAAVAQKNSRLTDAARHASAAAEVFTEIMRVPDKAIPRQLLDKAEAIAVFPGTKKGAFVVGATYGQGVISRRVKGGWSAPAFFNISGGSFGAQIGGQKTDYVLLIMNEEGVRSLMSDKFEIGGEISAAAGPVGRTASASTTPELNAGILTYSRSKGLFAGVSLKGTSISHDNDLNEAVYEGKKADAVLSQETRMNEMPAAVRIFPRTLARYSVRR